VLNRANDDDGDDHEDVVVVAADRQARTTRTRGERCWVSS
jgi:hypothetical protein